MTDKEDNHFTKTDVIEALEAFEDDFISYPKNSIRYKANIPFEPSVPRREKGKRLKQEKHLERARAVQNIDYPDGSWRDGNGRPKGSKNKKNKKQELVLEYAAKHKKATVTEIAKALGVSRTTVYKYLGDGKMDDKKPVKPQVDYMVKLPDGKEILIEVEQREQVEADREKLRKYFEMMTKGGKRE